MHAAGGAVESAGQARGAVHHGKGAVERGALRRTQACAELTAHAVARGHDTRL